MVKSQSSNRHIEALLKYFNQVCVANIPENNQIDFKDVIC